mmetsp:Transcript_80321/g.126693  ORF Transcript_80321/g.126693 Transcript_80321/m.126693 type:complete len:356 (-) Transcript_80321:80-1147(-)
MSTTHCSSLMLILSTLTCLTWLSYGTRKYVSARSVDKKGKPAALATLLYNQMIAAPKPRFRPSVFAPPQLTPREAAIDRLLDEAIVVETALKMPPSTDDSAAVLGRLLDESLVLERPSLKIPSTLHEEVVDPLAALKAREEQQKLTNYKLNVGYAIDNLNTDIPNILKSQPNWDIYIEDLELDLQAADAVAFRLVGGVSGVRGRKAEGLQANQNALRNLQRFRGFWVEHDEIRVKTRASVWSLLRSENGDDAVEIRWNAKLIMKPDIDLIPQWASHGIKFFQKHVFGVGSDDYPRREFVVDGVSRFFFNAEGKVYRHVVTDLELRPTLNMLEVDDILYMIGIQPLAPQLATPGVR